MEDKIENLLEKALLNNIGNKYQLVIKAAQEAKKIKEKEKIESLGQLALTSLEKVILKKEKQSPTETDKKEKGEEEKK